MKDLELTLFTLTEEEREGLKNAIERVKDIARSGSEDDKIAFAEWACKKIDYLNSQIAHECSNIEDLKNLYFVKNQYNAYLEELNKCIKGE